MGLLGVNRFDPTLASQIAALIHGFSGPKVWLDPADISTLQQDSAGTTPVTTIGDPIGRIMDKSGAANHAVQATAASRPLWQRAYAGFDGVDDSWATPSIDFSATDEVTVIAGVRRLSDAAAAILCELSASLNANAGTFNLRAPDSVGANYSWNSRGTTQANVFVSSAAAPVTSILCGIGDVSSDVAILRVNGVPTSSATDQGIGNYGNFPLFIGRRNNASLPFNGNLYGLIVIGRLLSESELTLCEKYMTKQAGL